jgi:hypothetical protein
MLLSMAVVGAAAAGAESDEGYSSMVMSACLLSSASLCEFSN